MGITRSVAITNARKSAGNLTFRTVRGRTIFSEKRGPNATKQVGESEVQFVFALLNRFIRVHRASIGLSFNKSRYGSQGNFFQKVNYSAMYQAFKVLFNDAQSSSDVSDMELETAVTTYATAHPDKIYRVLKVGQQTKYLTGAWSDMDDPSDNVPTPTATWAGASHNLRFERGVEATEGIINDLILTSGSDIIIKMDSIGNANILDVVAYNRAGEEQVTFSADRLSANEVKLSLNEPEDPFARASRAAYNVSYFVITDAIVQSFEGTLMLLD